MTTPLYKDQNATTDARVEDLLARMTLREKIAQLGSRWVFALLTDLAFDAEKASAELADGIGHITRVAGASNVTPVEGARLANRIQRHLREETRLGIPAIVHEECCAGYMAKGATQFPQIIGLASTWRPDLVERMTGVIRRQMRAAGARQGLSPVLDVARDPRWGRVEETYGEDPYLTSRMGAAYVRGLQGEEWRDGVLATLKHFVGHAANEGGMNWTPAHVPARELREVHLRPFAAAIRKANAQSVMSTYHEIDGVPSTASAETLTTLLRDELGFEGTVVSDYMSIEELEHSHGVARDEADAARLALSAGVDIELPRSLCYGEPLAALVEAGTLDVALVDRSVRRILRQKFELGLFENPYVDEGAVMAAFDQPEQAQLARELAQQAAVLLKNDGVLPLENVGRVALIGPNADDRRCFLGDYSYVAHIQTLLEQNGDGQTPFRTDTPKGLVTEQAYRPIKTVRQAWAARGQELVYARGCNINDDDRSGFDAAVRAAESADVAVMVMGGRSGLTDDCTCGEARDRTDLDLPGVQHDLIRAVHATGTPIVLVLVNGRPLSVTWEAANVAAIVEAWVPGEQGGEAIVHVLTGVVNPGGKLPITFPRHVGQVPIFHGHKPSGGKTHWKTEYVNMSNTPLYPFGFGLSYTTFEMGDLRVEGERFSADDSIRVQVDVTNSGERTGSEVVQLYTRTLGASVTRPVRELQAFERVELAAGETRTVTLAFPVMQLAYYDLEMRFGIEGGEVEVMVGSSAENLPLRQQLVITTSA